MNEPVLIVSASAGTGHVRAGDALLRAFADAGTEAHHVDVLTLAPRPVRLAYGGGFELLARRAPRVWAELYAWSDGPHGDHARWGPYAARALFGAFRRLLLSRSWAHCVCTHFLPAQLIAGGPGLPPTSLVITDHTLHRYWVQPRVSSYFVANAEVGRGVLARLPHARVSVTGIPIDVTSEARPTAAEVLAALGLSAERPVVLIVGGGLGIGVEASVDAALDATPDGVQLIAVCGRNDAARERLRARAVPGRLHVLGYVQQISDLLGAADVVVTKPGGLTTAEALALGRPLILTRPIPGHEEGNVRHLVGAGAALFAGEPAALRAALAGFFNDPGLRFRLMGAARGLGAPDAARRVVAVLEPRAAARRVA